MVLTTIWKILPDEVMTVPDIKLGDVVRFKKVHPCGGYEWQVTRLGADIGLKCLGCGRRVFLSRSTFNRSVRGTISR